MKQILSALLLAQLAVSCASDPAGPNGESARVAFSVRYAMPVSALSRLKKSVLQANIDSVTVDRARFLIRNVRLKSVIGDSIEFISDPMVIDLDLTSSEKVTAVRDVPAGTYNRLEFRIHRLDDDNPQDKAYFLHPDFFDFVQDNRYSMIIEGQVYESGSGSPYIFKSRANEKQERFLNPAISIDEMSGNIAVVLAVYASEWFIDENGDVLDPRDGSNESEISDNLRSSIKIEKGNYDNRAIGMNDDRDNY